MKPEDVPAELVDLAMRGAKPGCRSDAAFYLANVLPTIREQLIRQATGMVVHGPGGVGLHCETCDRSQFGSSGDVDASYVLARILGHATSPEHAGGAR